MMLERDWDHAFEQRFWEAVGFNFVALPFALVAMFVANFISALCVVAFFDFCWIFTGLCT